VRLAGDDLFNIQADAGGFTAEERTLIVERNLVNALMSSTDRSPNAVSVDIINDLPVVRLGGFHLVTADHISAGISHMSPLQLADTWAGQLRKALADTAKVSTYLAQITGNGILSPYVTPDHRTQYEAARNNHAAFAFREAIPVGLVSSKSFADEGMAALNTRCLDVALEKFRSSLAMDAGNARAHYGLGLTLLKKGAVDDAIDELQMARWLEPNYALAHLALGQAYETKGHDVEAIKQYQEAALLQPDNPEPYLFIADIREDRNDMRQSVAELTAAQFIMPSSELVRVRKKDQLAWRLRRPM